ncbi:MAG: Thiol-disulfide oxidoreductase ResA, partial [Planctomycetota bacterium]
MKYYAIPRPVLLFALGLCTVLFSASAALDHYSIGLIPTASAQEAAATEKKSSPKTSPAGIIGRIQLPNDDYAAGVLLASPSADRIRWQATQFIDPFEFTAAAVRSIQYPLPETLPNPQGEYCFELLGNDTLFGDLVSLDAQSIVLNSEALGRISIERSQVRRFYRWRGGAELLFLGPDGLAGWNQLENPKAWADEGGQPATKKPNAAIWRNFTLPDKCIIDFEVAWNAKADFTLAVGVPADKNLGRDAFRFEVWDNQLVAHREVSNAADLIPLMPVENGPGRAHFVTYLDQQAGRMLVCAPDGTMLGDLKVAASKPQTHPGLQLTNHRGDIRLERLRISRWDGTPPQTTDIARARILRTDGAITYGRIDGYDAAKREFVIDEDGQQKRIASEQIADVVPNASKPADTTTEPTTTPATAAASDPA